MTEFIFMITLRFQLYSSLIVEGFLDLAVLLLCVSAGILIAKGDLAVLSPLLHSIIASGDSTPFFVSNTCNTPWNCCSVMMWLSLIHVPSDAALNDCPDSWFLSFSGYHLHCTGADHLYHLDFSLPPPLFLYLPSPSIFLTCKEQFQSSRTHFSCFLTFLFWGGAQFNLQCGSGFMFVKHFGNLTSV